MKTSELKKLIKEGALDKRADLYPDTQYAAERYLAAIESFERRFGTEREVMVLSVPGRSELLGNHTDHNRGKVIAGAINRDIIAIASPSGTSKITVSSAGFPTDVVSLKDIAHPDRFRYFTSAALIAGVAQGITERGYTVGGFDAYTISDVPKGSGISSSAAYEVMLGTVINHLFCEGKIDNTEIAKVAQYAENVYFGKPSGLMDQMACAVGGFVYIDFGAQDSPVVKPVAFSLADHGYELCIVNTGGSHADLNDDYASIPREMREVAALLGREVLADTDEGELYLESKRIRAALGDRALLRAFHFVRENLRVERGFEALAAGDIHAFLKTVTESGNSSFKYLQNVYSNNNVREQGLSLALAVTEVLHSEAIGATRVHGGGFAGTIQTYVHTDYARAYVGYMENVFGEGCVMRLTVRGVGACRVF